jgi:hypothetical protein
MTLLKDALFTENDVIDPNWIIRYLLNHIPRGKVSGEQVHTVVKKMCKHIKGVRVKFLPNNKIKKCFAVGGEFDTEKKNSILLEISSSSYKKKFNLEEKYYDHLICDIADTLCHESIHRYQHNIRDYDEFNGFCPSEEQMYYSDPDEMFAYSVNIAHNLYRQFGDDVESYLSNHNELVKNDFYLADYYSLFYQQRTFNKLMKMIYLNIKAIQRGHICHRPVILHDTI